MEIGQRVKNHRIRLGMTQEELAEKLYVSRQTVSSWENNKSYPDIHSLLMLGNLFGVSLDTLIKGDIETMKEQIDRAEIRKFRRNNNIFAVLLFACILTPVPLIKWIGIPGLIVCISKLKVDTEKCLLFMYNGEKQGGEKDGKERHSTSKVQQGRKAEDRQRTFGGA